MNCSTIGTIFKNKNRMLEHVKGAVPTQSTDQFEKRQSDGGDGKTPLYVDRAANSKLCAS